jgi:hypothetical protein
VPLPGGAKPLPFRLVGITLEAVFSFLKALLFLPGRLLGGPKAA